MAPPTEVSEFPPSLEEAPLVVFEVDDRGEYVRVNAAACELLGYSREELLAMSVEDVLADGVDFEGVLPWPAPEEKETTRAEVGLMGEDGREIRVDCETVALEDGRFVAYCREVPEGRDRDQRRLEEQRDDLEVLNQVLRHDIRNDLQLITAYAELIEEKSPDDEDVQEYVRLLLKNADHAIELTTTARQMAHVMLTTESETHEVGLEEALAAEVEDVRSTHSEAVVSVTTPIPSVTIRADDMIGSVFRNVLKNAIQHNDKDVPEVTVSAAARDDAAVVRIADNGPGVPDEAKNTIFGKGEKGLDSPGSGMGLYLVRTLVENYGGDVWVEDNDPEGAVFVLELPKAG